jgi:RND family efflux transporter MFP subunit
MNQLLKSKRLVIALSSILIAVFSLSINGCSKEEAEKKQVIRPIRTFQIPSPYQFSERNFPGQAKATQEVDLAFRVAGPLVEFPVKVGDVVKTGDIVARVDPRDFEVNVQSAQGQLDNAKAASRRAASEYQRELNILKQDPGATSQTAVDRKREQRDKEIANIKSFEAGLESAKDQLQYTYLTAPFDGNVVKTYVENFENVQAKQSILRILDDSSIEMVVNISESLISLAPHVENIKVVFDTFTDTEIPAQVKEIGTEASSTTRTYPVTLIMDQPEGIKILPGMAGKASGTLPKSMTQQNFGIEIPVSAIFTDEASGNTFVWVVDETGPTVDKRPVEVGKIVDRGIRILSGLKEAEIIASAGVHYLFEGQKVKLEQNTTE